MGYQELIESLREEGAGKIQALRDETEAAADKITSQTAEKIGRLRQEFQDREISLITEQQRELISSVESKARLLRLSSEESLSARLFILACSLLAELRDKGYEELFAALAGELPAAEWDEVRVHPQDQRMARSYFPGAEIIADDQITGGMNVSAGKGRRRVINTFNKRLERAWGDLLPCLMNDIYKGKKEHGVPAGNNR